MSVPAGKAADSALPVGFQLIANHYQEVLSNITINGRILLVKDSSITSKGRILLVKDSNITSKGRILLVKDSNITSKGRYV